MGFFEELKAPEETRPDVEEVSPEWLHAPQDWLGGVVPLELLVGKSNDAAVYLTCLSAYPTGLSMTVEAFATRQADAHAFEGFFGARGEANALRLGIEFADGRKASNDGSLGARYRALRKRSGDPDPQADLMFMTQGGSGGDRHSHESCWIWPLPPPGPVTFACEWLALGIEESTAEVDGSVIRAAAERAQPIWDQ